MKPHDATPADTNTPPLRERPVGMRAETITALVGWGLRQERPAKGWIMRRAAAYWDKGEIWQRTGHAQLDATAALDLLAWRTEARTDREAVENLATWDGMAAGEKVGKSESESKAT